MSNNFCRLLSNGYKINIRDNQLLWSPCCYYTKKVPMGNKVEFIKELNYTSNATGWLPECNICQQMEKSEELILSPRIQSFVKVPEDVSAGDCVALEISFDTKCNAACLSCGPYCSTTWEKYNIKHNIHNPITKLDSSEYFLNELITHIDLSKVRDVFILGGEPFYTDTHVKLLKHLESIHPQLNQVTIRYQTNGTIIPADDVVELWKKFKSIEIGISIDGIGERFNYLRWPLKWHRLERTIDHLLTIPNIVFNINATVSPLNILYFHEIEKWTYSRIPKNLLKFSDKPVRPNRCFEPLNLNLTTVELRNDIQKLYGPDHRLSKMFVGLEFSDKYSTMFDYVKQHDAIRKLDWRSVFSESVRYYKQYQ